MAVRDVLVGSREPKVARGRKPDQAYVRSGWYGSESAGECWLRAGRVAGMIVKSIHLAGCSKSCIVPEVRQGWV